MGESAGVDALHPKRTHAVQGRGDFKSSRPRQRPRMPTLRAEGIKGIESFLVEHFLDPVE